MFSQFNQAAFATAKTLANQSGTWVALIHRTLRGLLTTAQHTLMLFGLGSLILAAVIYSKPESLSRLQASITRISQPAPAAIAQATPSTPITSVAASVDTSSTTAPASEAKAPPFASRNSHNSHITPATITIPNASHSKAGLTAHSDETNQEQRNVSAWLAKRYRVANDATHAVVHMTYQTAHEIEFDPLLILAVMAIESGFNPIAESPMGAQGLMQVMSKVHHARFKSHGGVKEALNPAANIKVGSALLKELVVRGGSVEAGLKSYVGASAFSSENGYGSRVMAEYQRLKQVAQGKDGSQILPVARQSAPADAAKANDKDEVVAL